MITEVEELKKKKDEEGITTLPDDKQTQQGNNTNEEEKQDPITFSEEQRQISNELDDAANEEPTTNTSKQAQRLINNNTSTTPPPSAAESKEKTHRKINSVEDYLNEFGINLPAEKKYSTEERQMRLEKRKSLSALGEAFKLIAETGGALAGSYTDKRDPNPYMAKLDAKIQELKDKDLLDQRRIEQNRVNNKVRGIGMYNDYITRKDNQGFREGLQKDSQEFRSEENKKSRDNQKELVTLRSELDNNNNLEYKKDLLELQNEYAIKLDNAKTANDKEVIKSQLEKEIARLKEYHRLKNEGKLIDIEGKQYSESQINNRIAEILTKKSENKDEFGNLDPEIEALLKKKDLSDIDKIMLIKKFGLGSLDDNPNKVSVDDVIDPLNEVSPEYKDWIDEQLEEEAGGPVDQQNKSIYD